MLFFEGFIMSLFLYFRIFWLKKSKPSLMWVMLVFSGDIVNSGEVGDVVTSRRLPTITKVILYFTLFGCKK